MVRRSWIPLVCCAAALQLSCNLVDNVVDNAALCTDACLQIQDCDATPPTPEFAGFGAASTGEGGLDCAASCTADDRELRGYADCQLTCITEVKCGEVQDCWKPRSAAYAKYCLDGRDVPDLGAPADEAPANGTVTGSAQVDEIVTDPAVAIAVDEAADDGFELNYGDDPPQLVGKYQVSGKIDSSSNARPEGSRIETSICFWDFDDSAIDGVRVSYCEDGVPGEDTAPLTGTNGDFTAYFEFPGQATILFSGAMNGDGTLSQVEALVVYTYATDVWELSHTDWTPIGTCDRCDP
ncbi:MAG: hypothetical protein R3F59_04875 [Myxococcota bacterium]